MSILLTAYLTVDLRPYISTKITIPGQLIDKEVFALLDTGSNKCFLSHKFVLDNNLSPNGSAMFSGIHTDITKPPDIRTFNDPVITLFDNLSSYTNTVSDIGFIEKTVYDFDIVIGCNFLKFGKLFYDGIKCTIEF